MNAAQRALGEKVLEHLIHHPEQHDQEHFGERDDCGTTACVAGWTVLLAAPLGVKPRWALGQGGFQTLADVRMPDGAILDPDAAARELLGLTLDQTEELFYDTDGKEEARAVLREILDAAPVPS